MEWMGYIIIGDGRGGRGGKETMWMDGTKKENHNNNNPNFVSYFFV